MSKFHDARAIGFGSRVMLLTGIAGVAPWLLAGWSLARDPVAGFAAPVALTGCATLLALAAQWRTVRPVGHLARLLRQRRSKAGPSKAVDDVEAIVESIGQMEQQVASLQHRWVQRNPVSDLPTREFLLAEMAADIESCCGEAVLGVLRLKDYDRLAAFDPQAADRVLGAFARQLRAAVGSRRPLAQVDRDSFAIWFRGSPPDLARTELRAICYAMSAEVITDDQPLVPEVSASAGLYPVDGADALTLLTRTLISSHDAFHPEGRSGCVSAPALTHVARERFALEQDLRQAMSRGELDLRFQPIVDLAQGKLVGAEALIRWNHPRRGPVSPVDFIPVVEDVDLTDEVGLWALNAACRACRHWRTEGQDRLTVAVNLSAGQLKSARLVEAVTRTLERHRLPPTALALELTETAAMADFDRTLALFSELRARGIGLSIDDFGSGYSSLSYVKNLPFDKLKIDREFVVDVHQRRDSQAICRTLVELARGLCIRILAEGVEQESEVEFLDALGCNLFQGFYFSRPLQEADFLRLANDKGWQERLQSWRGRPGPTRRRRMTA